MDKEGTELLREVLVDELRDIRADVRLMRESMQGLLLRVTAVEQHAFESDKYAMARHEKCSAEFKKLGSTITTVENTGVHNIIDYNKWKMTWSILRITIASIVGAAALGLSMYGAFRCNQDVVAKPRGLVVHVVKAHGSVVVVKDAGSPTLAQPTLQLTKRR